MNYPSSVAFNLRACNNSTFNIYPDVVYVETNTIMDVILGRTYKEINITYWEKLIANGCMITWSYHTVDEVTNVIHHNEYRNYSIKNNIVSNIPYKQDWKFAEDTMGSLESRAMAQDIVKKSDSFFRTLGKCGLPLELDYSVGAELGKSLYTNYGGSLADAKHVACTNSGGINSIMTHDSGILRYPGLNVLGASKSLIENSNPSSKLIEYVDLSGLIGNPGGQDRKSS